MFLSKKIAKIRMHQASVTKESKQVAPVPTKDLQKKKQPTLTRCRFVDIPPQKKFIFPSHVYLAYGDIPLMVHDGRIMSELSLFNDVKGSQSVSIDEVYGQKIVSMKLNERMGKESPDWNELLDQVSQLDSTENAGWNELLKTHALTYSKVMQRQSRKKMKSDQRKRFFIHVTEETEKRKKELFESSPCLHLKFRLKNHQNQLKEVLFSEDFVKIMGYSTEEFVTLIQQEGLPQLMPYENPLASQVMKVLLANYFTIKDTGLETPESETVLLMKNNFSRNMKFKTHFLMNYETNTFGIDMIITPTRLGEPFVQTRSTTGFSLNEGFLQIMAQREIETDYFSTVYYDQPTRKNYTNIHKTCMIKELGVRMDDFIVVKKCEEDSI